MNEATRAEYMNKVETIKNAIERADGARDVVTVLQSFRLAAIGQATPGAIYPLHITLGRNNAITVAYTRPSKEAAAAFNGRMRNVLNDVRDFVITRLDAEIASCYKTQDKSICEVLGVKDESTSNEHENREARGVRVRKKAVANAG